MLWGQGAGWLLFGLCVLKLLLLILPFFFYITFHLLKNPGCLNCSVFHSLSIIYCMFMVRLHRLPCSLHFLIIVSYIQRLDQNQIWSVWQAHSCNGILSSRGTYFLTFTFFFFMLSTFGIQSLHPWIPQGLKNGLALIWWLDVFIYLTAVTV